MDDIKSKLEALARGAKRPVFHRVADLYPWIERALAAGVSRQTIVETLNDGGIAIGLRQLDNYLYRLRKRKAPPARAAPPAADSSAGPQAAPPADPAPAASADRSHDPQALKDILRSTPDLDAYARLARERKK